LQYTEKGFVKDSKTGQIFAPIPVGLVGIFGGDGKSFDWSKFGSKKDDGDGKKDDGDGKKDDEDDKKKFGYGQR
jgi:hypothetical protein